AYLHHAVFHATSSLPAAECARPGFPARGLHTALVVVCSAGCGPAAHAALVYCAHVCAGGVSDPDQPDTLRTGRALGHLDKAGMANGRPLEPADGRSRRGFDRDLPGGTVSRQRLEIGYEFPWTWTQPLRALGACATWCPIRCSGNVRRSCASDPKRAQFT